MMIGTNLVYVMTGSSGQRPPRPSSKSDTPRLGLTGRILIVEDEYFVALTIEDALVEAGYEVIGVVSSGEEAITKGASLRPDLVLMDIRLAGKMSGIEAATELRQHGIVSLFASAHSDLATRSSGEQAQPAGWLTKPFSSSELVATVAAALAKIASN